MPNFPQITNLVNNATTLTIDPGASLLITTNGSIQLSGATSVNGSLTINGGTNTLNALGGLAVGSTGCAHGGWHAQRTRCVHQGRQAGLRRSRAGPRSTTPESPKRYCPVPYGNLTLSGSGAATKTLPAGPLSILNSFAMSGQCRNYGRRSGDHRHRLLVEWLRHSFNASTHLRAALAATSLTAPARPSRAAAQTFTLGGATPTIGGIATTFNNVTLSGTAATLGASVTVAGTGVGTLNIGNSVVTTGANTLALTSTTATLARNTGFVNGKLQKAIPTGCAGSHLRARHRFHLLAHPGDVRHREHRAERSPRRRLQERNRSSVPRV